MNLNGLIALKMAVALVLSSIFVVPLSIIQVHGQMSCDVWCQQWKRLFVCEHALATGTGQCSPQLQAEEDQTKQQFIQAYRTATGLEWDIIRNVAPSCTIEDHDEGIC
jgi:hypothetical protein